MLKTHTTSRVAILALACAAAALLPDTAYASDDIAAVEDTANQVLRFLTGPIATAAGAIAIAVTGYRWFSGRIELGRAVAIVAGIVLVLGSVQIVNLIRQGTGVTGGVDTSASLERPATTALAGLAVEPVSLETVARV